jgi:two-component system response regulator RegX3
MFEIMIVDDEPAVADVLEIALRREGFNDVHTALTGRDALSLASSSPWSLVILDIGLPDMSGLDLAATLRERSPDVAILFLSARDSTADTLMAFGVGADDYVTKPFNPLEVVARARALLRRNAKSAQQENRVFDFGRFEIRPDQGRLIVAGRDTVVPAREFQLLSFLAQNAGTVYSAAEIYRAVWSADPIGAADHNTVCVHIHRLRERIEPTPSQPQYLLTIRGLGHKLVRPSDG